MTIYSSFHSLFLWSFDVFLDSRTTYQKSIMQLTQEAAFGSFVNIIYNRSYGSTMAVFGNSIPINLLMIFSYDLPLDLYDLNFFDGTAAGACEELYALISRFFCIIL